QGRSPTVAGRLGECGSVCREGTGRHARAIAVCTTVKKLTRPPRDVLRREVEMLVDVGIGRRGAKAIQGDHVTLETNPALPAEWRRGFNADPSGDARRQHVV